MTWFTHLTDLQRFLCGAAVVFAAFTLTLSVLFAADSYKLRREADRQKAEGRLHDYETLYRWYD